MSFGRKAAVGTALDKEELEQLLERLDAGIDTLKNAIWELEKSTKKAARVVEDLNKAAARAESTSRRRLSRGS